MRQPEERDMGHNVPWWQAASAVPLIVRFTERAEEREALSSHWHGGRSAQEGKEGRKQVVLHWSPLGNRLEMTAFALVLLLDVLETILLVHCPASSHTYFPSWLPSNQEPWLLLLARCWEVWKEELPSFHLPTSVPRPLVLFAPVGRRVAPPARAYVTSSFPQYMRWVSIVWMFRS